jgi:membrane-associated phospholipid phosphatase
VSKRRSDRLAAANRLARELALVTLAWSCALASVPALAHAQQQPAPAAASPACTAATTHERDHRLVWNEAWPRFRPIGYVVTSASVLSAVAVTLFLHPTKPHWTGGVLFDDAARDTLRARDPGVRDAIRLASDITLITTVAQDLLIDGALIPLADGSPDVAAQLSLMNTTALSLNILVTTVLKAVGRERPLIADCRKNPNFDPLCNSQAYESFPSAHSGTAFTAAGLTCVHHAYLPIYGSGAGDSAACIGSLTLATATGLFRVVGDRHYASDVLVGAAIGFSIGYIYPWLMHYRFGNSLERVEQAATWGVLPAPPYGLQLAGQF